MHLCLHGCVAHWYTVKRSHWGVKYSMALL